MEQTLYYYSATGNSLFAAQTLAARMGNTTLTTMTPWTQFENVVPTTKNIGLVFPMHYFGLPPVVEEFVKKLDLTSVQYIFAIVTCGDHHLSSCLHQLKQALRKKGKNLAAGFYIDMISSYVPLFPLPPLEHRQKMLAVADIKLQKVANVLSKETHIVKSEYFWWPCSKVNSYWKRKILPQSYRKFSNSEACTACGSCEKVCPVANIHLVKGKPIWRRHCQECLACFHFCPVQSINFGTRTEGRERYHHPQITITDIIQSRSSEPVE